MWGLPCLFEPVKYVFAGYENNVIHYYNLHLSDS